MTENGSLAKIRQAAINELEKGAFWVISHPVQATVFICIGAVIASCASGWFFTWSITAFYPAHFDYSSICIGGGCP